MSEKNNVESFLCVRLKSADDFLKIKETLTRIGIASFRNKKLYQSCHILHKQGLYYIVHFKELFELDGRGSNISNSDIERRNMITKLLIEWGLCCPVNFDPDELDVGNAFSKTKILRYSEIHEWTLESKHNLGKRK